MAEKSRLETLEDWVKAKPADAFSRYALALEYRSAGRNDDAVGQFRALNEKNADYVPAYLMHGQLLNQMGRPEEAKKVLETGLGVANRVGNAHAAKEMSELLSML